jgi:hypothetical protein
MTFKPATWYPIAIVLSVVNLVAVGFTSPPWHAAGHAVLAVAFGLWAQRLRQRSRTELKDEVRGDVRDSLERFEALEAEVIRLRQELTEAQERLDFAERLLAQRPEQRRVGPQQ